MLPVSVVIPTRNEEKNLEKCLECLHEFSEIMIVDSSSTDKTCQIAKSHNIKVIEFKWNGRFPKKRNWVLRNYKFKNDWILFLDSDEYVTQEFKKELREVIPLTSHSGFWINYNNYFMGHILKHGDKFKKLALFKIGSGEYERIDEHFWSNLDMEIHEHPVLNGTVGQIKAPIIHRDFKTLKDYINRHNEYSDWEAYRYLKMFNSFDKDSKRLTYRQKIKYMLLNSWLLSPIYFLSSYILKIGFLDGKAGLIFAIFKTYYFFQIKCKILELKKQEVSQVGSLL